MKESMVIMSEIVLPNDTNPLGILLGGKLLHWMDIAAVICAQNHTNSIVVTAAVFNVSFVHPIFLGDTVFIEATISRVFNTSLEIKATAYSKELKKTKKVKAAEAYLTFSLKKSKKKIKPIVNSSELEYEMALVRRKINKILVNNNSKDYLKLMHLINNNF